MQSFAPYISYYKTMLSVSNETTFRLEKAYHVKCSDIPFRTRAAALLKRHVKEILKNVVLECTLLVTFLGKQKSNIEHPCTWQCGKNSTFQIVPFFLRFCAASANLRYFSFARKVTKSAPGAAAPTDTLLYRVCLTQSFTHCNSGRRGGE